MYRLSSFSAIDLMICWCSIESFLVGMEGGAGTKSLFKYISSSALAKGSVSRSFGVPV